MPDLDEEELKATIEMKQINKIIAPEEKSADEMFEELGFKKVIDNEKEVKYQYKNTIMGDRIEHTIQIAKIGKIIFSYRDDTNHQVMGFSKDELKAINKKCQELRMDMKVKFKYYIKIIICIRVPKKVFYSKIASFFYRMEKGEWLDE